VSGLARWCFRHRLLVILAWAVLLVGSVAAGGAAGTAYNDAFSLPGTDSSTALDLLQQAFPAQSGDRDTVVWHVSTGSVTDPAVQIRISTMLDTVAHSAHVRSVSSPYPDARVQVGADRRTAYATIIFDRQPESLPTSAYRHVITIAQAARAPGLQVELGGPGIEHAQQPSLSATVVIGFIAAALVLLFAFASLAAMSLPLVTAIATLGTAIPAIGLLSHLIDVATVTTALGLLLGLGVGVDYALFVVSRHRAGLLAGRSAEQAAITALGTAGRAVLFAGGTVCVAILSLFSLGIHYFNGMALATAGVVLIAVAASLSLLPALFGLLGTRVLSRRERRQLITAVSPARPTGAGWSRWAAIVRHHSVPLAIAATLVMLVLAAPLLSLRLGSADAGNDPANTTTRKAYDLLAHGFGPGFNGPLQLVLRTPPGDGVPAALVSAVTATPDVAAVNPPASNSTKTITLLTVVPASAPQDKATSDLIHRLRTRVIPQAIHPQATRGEQVRVYVGGVTAVNEDFATRLQSKLPLFLGVVVALGSLLLLLAFRSVLVPVTAAIMNLLAAAAAFGVLTAIFQWGWASTALGAGRAGPIETFLPVFTLAILFGLSMDYEVFLVSRMHEEWTTTRDNAHAVTSGQGAGGRIISAAAAIMICVFAAFALGRVRVEAEFGIGLAVAVALDAFVLRTVLLPAAMNKLGPANWWLPHWLDRILPNLSIEQPATQPNRPSAATTSAATRT